MRCPSCCAPSTVVVETVNSSRAKHIVRNETKRRRRCKHCGGLFTTYEYPVHAVDALEAPLTSKEESKLKRQLAAEGLEDVNKTRAAAGLPPIDKLPKSL